MKKRLSKKIASFFCYIIHRANQSEHATPPWSIFTISWPRRGHMSLAIWSLAAQNVSMYPLVPGGINVFIVPLCALRNKMLETCDPEGVRCGILGEFLPPGAGLWDRFFFVSWPRRGHMSLAIWSLAAQNVSLYPFCPWRHKIFQCTLWSLAG